MAHKRRNKNKIITNIYGRQKLAELVDIMPEEISSKAI
jgi:hypothetical protein